MDTLELNDKIAKLPPEMQEEVKDFVDFLAQKKRNNMQKSRTPGKAKGLIVIHSNFNDPVEEFNLMD